MPIDILSTAYFDGPDAIPGWHLIKYATPAVAVIAGIKWYFAGASNTFDRNLHGRVFIITGGTSGMGAQIAFELANKGAQLILLCRSTDDPWTVDFVDNLREITNNELIYAEKCDLRSLHLVRTFATTFLDNQPPRRLDGVICCAADCIPRGSPRQLSVDGVEQQMAVNYLAHYHLLTLLKPLLHVQPPDRDVRIVLVNCTSQLVGKVNESDLLWEKRPYPTLSPLQVFGASKLLLGIFGRAFQRNLNEYERKDKAPCNVKVSIVNPGIMRTPSTRRMISMGSLLGLLFYLIAWPLWWLFLKSAEAGAQSVFFALFAPVLGALDGGNIIQECRLVKNARAEYYDYELQDRVFSQTAELIEKIERQSAVERKKEEKRMGIDKKKAEQEQKKREDIHQKPENTQDLELKLDIMRQLLGVPMGLPEINRQAKTGTAVATKRKGKGRKSG